jgi:hypothetical protein
MPEGRYVLLVGWGPRPFSGFKCAEVKFIFAPGKEWAQVSKIKIKIKIKLQVGD